MTLNHKMLSITLLALVLLIGLFNINCAGPGATTTETTTPTTPPITTEQITTTDLETTSDSTRTQVTPEGRPFIWKISSESTYVYLLGSIHVAEESLYPLANVIVEAFEEAKALVVEVDISNIDEMRTLELMLEYGTYPAGEGLKNNLPEELYVRLETRFAEWGIPLPLLDSYRPWFIENLISITSMEDIGYSAEYGIDLYFLEAAVTRGMDIIELETEEFQIGLLADIPDDVMIQSIEQLLDDPVTRQEIDELFIFWKTSDVQGMEEYLFEGLMEDPSIRPYYQGLFIDRNYNMQEKIEEFLEDDMVYFIVVGAEHLVGEEGLLNLLEEAGYAVEQLEYPTS